MNLTNAYIIEGDVLKKLLDKINSIPKPINGDTRLLLTGIKSDLEELEQHLKPALPIVEEAYETGEDYNKFIMKMGLELDLGYIVLNKQDFLTKDF